MSGGRDQVSNLSFVVNSVDDARFESFRQNLETALAPHVPELIRISDARSMAEGLNRGASSAGGDWLVFCHDDILILNSNSNTPLLLTLAMRACDMFGCCGTTRLTSGNWYDAGHPFTLGHVVARDVSRPGKYELQMFGSCESDLVIGVQALDGILIACRRCVFDALRGFNETTYGFVGYDIDFSFRASLAQFRVGVCCALVVFHDSHVAEFSTEKIKAWEQAQRDFERRFRRYLTQPCGHRGHETVPLDRLEDALPILVQRQRRYNSWWQRFLRKGAFSGH